MYAVRYKQQCFQSFLTGQQYSKLLFSHQQQKNYHLTLEPEHKNQRGKQTKISQYQDDCAYHSCPQPIFMPFCRLCNVLGFVDFSRKSPLFFPLIPGK